MAGYKGYSMSNNAFTAYENGRKPLSKWVKLDFVGYVQENYNNNINFNDKIKELKATKIETLRKLFLTKSGWHHTSSRYNRTNFYCINENEVEAFMKSEEEKLQEQLEKERKLNEFNNKVVEIRKNYKKATCAEIGKEYIVINTRFMTISKGKLLHIQTFINNWSCRLPTNYEFEFGISNLYDCEIYNIGE